MRPTVIGITLLAVHDAEAIHLARLEIEHIEVCLGMPDREGAVVCYREEAILAIGTNLRVAYGTLLIERVYLRAELASLFIKWDANQGILQSSQIGGVQSCRARRAVIYVLAIGREGRECL